MQNCNWTTNTEWPRDRERYEARRIVAQGEKSFTSGRDLPFTIENNSDLVSYIHDTFGNDFIAAEGYLRSVQGLNAWETNVIIGGAREITEERFEALDTTLAQTSEAGNAIHTLMTGGIPNYKESYLLSPAEMNTARELFLAESDQTNPFPGAANDQYAWALSQPLPVLAGMDIATFRDQTTYLRGTDRQKANLRYRAARWSDPKALGKFENIDLHKIRAVAHDMAAAADLEPGDDEYNTAVANYSRELQIALEPVSGVPLDVATVTEAGREITARMPDYQTSSLLSGMLPDDDWEDIRRKFKNNPTADQIRLAEDWFPTEILDSVNEATMKTIIAAQNVIAAPGVRPSVRRQAQAEMLLILDQTQERYDADQADLAEKRRRAAEANKTQTNTGANTPRTRGNR